jgi:hypothetical protein
MSIFKSDKIMEWGIRLDTPASLLIPEKVLPSFRE